MSDSSIVFLPECFETLIACFEIVSGLMALSESLWYPHILHPPESICHLHPLVRSITVSVLRSTPWSVSLPVQCFRPSLFCTPSWKWYLDLTIPLFDLYFDQLILEGAWLAIRVVRTTLGSCWHQNRVFDVALELPINLFHNTIEPHAIYTNWSSICHEPENLYGFLNGFHRFPFQFDNI